MSDLPERYVCQICGADLLNDRDLTVHRAIQHECPVCEMLFGGPLEISTHLRRAHHVQMGNRLDFEGTDGFMGCISEPVAGPCCPLDIDLALLRIPRRRMPSDPWPSRAEDLPLWLYPMCLRLVSQREVLEFGLKGLAPQLENPSKYVETYWPYVRAACKQKRFRARKTLEAKAEYLAKSLSLPELSPGRAEQKLRGLKFKEVFHQKNSPQGRPMKS